MARPSFRARSLLTSCLVSVPAIAVLFVACGNQAATAPPANQGNNDFGDGSTSPKHDATAPKHDAGHDAAKDTGRAADATEAGADAPATISDAGIGTPCTAASQCATGVCEPMANVDKEGGSNFDAGICETMTCLCQASTCTDGVKNGQETGVDCGGSVCPACPVGSPCDVGTDCTQKECGVGFAGARCNPAGPDAGADASGDAGACVCEAPTCSDGVQNQDETDVDCGGSTCAKCPTGKACGVPGDCTSDVCTTKLCACPSGMTEAPTSNSVPYCIDTYEVTYGQYSAFIGSANSTTLADQPSECSWNTTFVPSGDWPQVGAQAKNPVSYVNWCDALAYCSSVGHHLCGGIANVHAGTSGGTAIPLASVAEFQDASVLAANDPSVDEWYNACSGQGQTVYPYGNDYETTWCNGVDSPPQRTSGPVEIPPGTLNYAVDSPPSIPSCVLDTSCVGNLGILSTVAQNETLSCTVRAPTMGAIAACGSAYMESGCFGGSSTNQIFDLSGNVAEWENSCSANAGATDNCAVRGGAYDSPNGSQSLTCASSGAQPPQPRNTQAADIGFRCCL